MRRDHGFDRGPPTALEMLLRLVLIVAATAAICSCAAFFKDGF